MLQKLLIASFAAFVLSACSGSDSSSSETVNDPPPAPNPDNPEEPEEPVGPTVLASMFFEDETSVDSWQVRCAGTGSCDADLSQGEEDVLVVSPTWVTSSDNLEVYTALDPEIADLERGTVEIDVRVTEEYLTDGNLRMQVFFENAAGGVAYTGWTTPETEYENEDGEMVSSNGWTQLEFKSIRMSSFSSGYVSDSFTLQNINAMGVQFVSNGKPVDVGGQLWIDNIRILEAPEVGPPVPVGFINIPTDSGWYVNDDAAPMAFTDAGAEFYPTAADQQFVYNLAGPVDLSGASVEIEFTVDADYIASQANLQPFAQSVSGGSLAHWGCWINAGDLVAGENTTTCVLPADFQLADEQSVIKIGFQPKGTTVDGTIVVTDMTINLADGITVPSDQYGEPAPVEEPFNGFVLEPTAENIDAWDADNWQGRNGAPDFSFNSEEEVLVISPNWDADDNNGERTVMYVFEEGVLDSLEGATITYDLYLPEYYTSTNPGMEFQFYIQQASDPWTGLFGDNFAIADGEDLGDGWFRFERTFTDVPTNPDPLRVGLKLQRESLDTGGEAGADIWLREIKIKYAD